MDVSEFTRVYLALLYTAVAVFYTTRIILMQQACSQKLVYTGERYSSTWWNHTSFRVFRVAIWLICVLSVFYPAIVHYLGMLESFYTSVVMLTGLVFLTFGTVSAISIHLMLGDAWRSGIDEKGPNHLITDGVYRYSRNPMFVCVAIAQTGFFLALPSVFSLVCLVIGWYALTRQIIAEEAHLERIHSDAYRAYCVQTRRWL